VVGILTRSVVDDLCAVLIAKAHRAFGVPACAFTCDRVRGWRRGMRSG
jgi:hypothetical protein